MDVVAEDAEGRFYLRSTALDPGYDDARYAIEAGRYGRQGHASWAELPHVYSSSARTLYQRPSPEVFRLPAGVQTRIAGAASPRPSSRRSARGAPRGSRIPMARGSGERRVPGRRARASLRSLPPA
ncbi:MAG: MtrB/PioB family outer membrane beta-barrel protein [Myxococcota bacterium]